MYIINYKLQINTIGTIRIFVRYMNVGIGKDKAFYMLSLTLFQMPPSKYINTVGCTFKYLN